MHHRTQVRLHEVKVKSLSIELCEAEEEIVNENKPQDEEKKDEGTAKRK